MASKRKTKKTSRESTTPTEEEFTIKLPTHLTEKLGCLQDPLIIASLVSLLLVVLRPAISSESLLNVIPYVLFILFAASSYIAKTYFDDEKDYLLLGVPVLALLTALFSWYVNLYPGTILNRDYQYFAIIAGLFLMAYTLMVRRVVSAESAIVGAIIISALLLHLVPALEPLLGNLDSYWQYKFMQGVYAGNIPDRDDLVYPMVGGLNHFNDTAYIATKDPAFTNPKTGIASGVGVGASSFMSPVLYGSMALILKPFGFSLYDLAILIPGIIGGLCSLLMYLLVKELFADMSPYNKVAAALAAFMLFLSPGFAINGTASNCEDDVLGMFFTLGGLYLFFTAVNRKSYKYAFMAGVAFMMLRASWGGYNLAYLTAGAFCSVYALVSLFRNENCMRLVPYFIILIFISEGGSSLFLHSRGAAPTLSIPTGVTTLIPILGAVGGGIIFEFIRRFRKGGLSQVKASADDRIIRFMENNIVIILIVVIILGASAFYMAGGIKLLDGLYHTVMWAKERSIVHATVAEQNAMASDFGDFIVNGYDKYGIALFYGLLMIPIMLYLVFTRNSMGALFVLVWSLPMMWGSANKSAWIFAAAPAITALGSTIGLFA
ncbi:MAG: hypothetical protein NTU61_06260, partial [Candidatus Altiarchaeota archaeon]|nr:hypothetical protein [Candidatus Altiarchaeota archaeon]